MQKQSAEVAYWLKKCQACARTGVKTAAGDGNSGDVPFEQAFSNLAHAALKNAAPGLLDYEVGFQLIDRNDEDTKAVGVFAFKLGNQWLLAPIFFLNGKLKGTEFLYLKNQDMFVPLSEKWLNYLLNRKPDVLGDGVDRNSSRLGISFPDLRSIQRSPQNKMAGAVDAKEVKRIIDETIPVFAAIATTHPQVYLDKLGSMFSLPKFLKASSLNMLRAFEGLCREKIAFAEWFHNEHGLETVTDAVKTARARERESASVLSDSPAPRTQVGKSASVLEKHADPAENGKLKIITPGLQVAAPSEDLTQAERETLFKDKVLIKDDRDDEDISIPYNVQVAQRLENPTQTGLFEVLVKPNEFEKCLIIKHPVVANGRGAFVTVVRTGDDANWINVRASDVWVGNEATLDEYKEWYDGLTEATSFDRDGARYILISPQGDGTAPFSVLRSYGDSEVDGECYEIRFDDYVRHDYCHGSTPSGYNDCSGYSAGRDGARIHLDGARGSKFRSMRGEVYVPAGFKRIKVRKSWEERMADEDAGKDSPPAIRPGDLIDGQILMTSSRIGAKANETKTEYDGKTASLQLATVKQAQAWFNSETSGLTIVTDGQDITINDRRFGHLDAVIHLVRDHALREKEARAMLKLAARKRKFSCRLKYPVYKKADNLGPYMAGQGTAAPVPREPQRGQDFGTAIPTQGPSIQQLQVPGLSGAMTDRNIYNPNTPIRGGMGPQEMRTIDTAMQTGQKEVIEATAISNMLKTVNSDNMIDQYMGALLRGLDALCRILFFFYWHGEEFADRFGKQDLPELEDALTNTIESMGDCVIFLRKKSVDPYPGEGDLDLDLENTANA